MTKLSKELTEKRFKMMYDNWLMNLRDNILKFEGLRFRCFMSSIHFVQLTLPKSQGRNYVCFIRYKL